MSNFLGRFNELPNIIADNFTQDNYDGTCFFLSHCHTDHMRGLQDDGFIATLLSAPDIYLYCSSLTRLILTTFEKLKPVLHKIKGLNVGLISVTVPSKTCLYNITVQCIPAGHCPGSFIFLFETAKSTVLYTGDFRISHGDYKRFHQLRDGHCPKVIDTIYLDSTFFCELYTKFPSRDDSIAEIIRLTKEWLVLDAKNEVQIEMPANYGGETILMEVSKALRCRINTRKEIFDMYLHVPEISAALTEKTESTRIYSRRKGTPMKGGIHIRCILPSAMAFICRPDAQPIIGRKGSPWGTLERVNYSSHCSYSEIVDFLNYLQPKNIIFCTPPLQTTEEWRIRAISKLKTSWRASNPAEPTLNLKSISLHVRDIDPDARNSKRRLPLKIVIPQKCCRTNLDDLDFSPQKK